MDDFVDVGSSMFQKMKNGLMRLSKLNLFIVFSFFLLIVSVIYPYTKLTKTNFDALMFSNLSFIELLKSAFWFNLRQARPSFFHLYGVH